MNILRNWKFWIWVLILLLGAGLVFMIAQANRSARNVAVDATPFIPQELLADSPAPVATPTAEAEATPAPSATPEATPAATAQPGPVAQTYLLTFAGDCTLASQRGSTAAYTFQGVVGEDYGWPFRLVQDYFAHDTMTLVNLECVFTTSNGIMEKAFNFKADPKYAACLKEGSVEVVSVANNHSEDYGHQGFADTLEAVKGVGVEAATFNDPAIFTAEDGFKIGVIAGYYPSVESLQAQYDACQEQKCDIVVAAIHMGNEYYYRPTGSQRAIAHACIDMGCVGVFMHHPHVLQPIEYYNGYPIAYSLGNFSFGGNVNPRDKDTAIVQLPVTKAVDGTITLGELIIIPCSITSEGRNNYQPVPLKEDDPAYARVMSKLNGTFAVDNIARPGATEPPEETPEPLLEPTVTPTAAPGATPVPTNTLGVTNKPTNQPTGTTPEPTPTSTDTTTPTTDPTPGTDPGTDEPTPSTNPGTDEPAPGGDPTPETGGDEPSTGGGSTEPGPGESGGSGGESGGSTGGEPGGSTENPGGVEP